MGIPKKPLPVKYVVGVIVRPDALENIEKAIEELGGCDLRSEVFSFDTTNYYEDEMGPSLIRFWISLKGLRDPGELASFKLRTNELEAKFLDKNGKRRVNLDPGYITESNLILATTKNYSHRIYLSNGIYAEVTLIYKRKTGFEPLPWTYPDYRWKKALEFFKKVREKYREELKKELRNYVKKLRGTA